MLALFYTNITHCNSFKTRSMSNERGQMRVPDPQAQQRHEIHPTIHGERSNAGALCCPWPASSEHSGLCCNRNATALWGTTSIGLMHAVGWMAVVDSVAAWTDGSVIISARGKEKAATDGLYWVVNSLRPASLMMPPYVRSSRRLHGKGKGELLPRANKDRACASTRQG